MHLTFARGAGTQRAVTPSATHVYGRLDGYGSVHAARGSVRILIGSGSHKVLLRRIFGQAARRRWRARMRVSIGDFSHSLRYDSRDHHWIGADAVVVRLPRRFRDGLHQRRVGAVGGSLRRPSATTMPNLVLIRPDSITTTRMPKSASSSLRQSDHPSRACLVAWYQAPRGV